MPYSISPENNMQAAFFYLFFMFKTKEIRPSVAVRYVKREWRTSRGYGLFYNRHGLDVDRETVGLEGGFGF